MKRRIFLYGHLKEACGEYFDFDVDTPKMAIRGLCSQIKGFKEALKEGSYCLLYGEDLNIDETQLDLTFGNTKEFHIVPHVEGSGGGKALGIVKLVLGVTLLAFAVGGAILAGGAFGAAAMGPTLGLVASLGLPAIGGITYGAIAGVGLALSVMGASSLLTSKAKVGPQSYDSRELADDARQSFLYNGPVNKSAQGQAIPLVYGRVRVGSIIASAGISAEAI